MQRLTREGNTTYDLVAAEPRLVVDPGEEFVVETEDAMGGVITREDQPPDASSFGPALAADEFNPCTGPVAVRGASPGDVLAIDIVDIALAPSGVACVFEGVGPLADSFQYADCRGPFTRVIEQRDGVGSLGDVSFALQPHIGTIAVAPARGLSAGADANYGQGAWGGNLDCRLIAPGNRLLLPVAVEGAQLYVGDVHGAMADGELFGTGVETRAEVTLRCSVLPATPLPFARVQTPTHLVFLNSTRPLEAGIDEAFRWAMDWLVEEVGMAARDAYVLLGIHPEVRIDVFQMVRLGRLAATVGVSVPLELAA
ncbi:acetamidase/formamidase family protein [Svornostia abyssi]|uniref:Acetamidase/formamidase family protein n=1 Tax=Svornostia abyssi TaxID=2898438 RepID=A0ABY5PIL1_9ACTN|nr:acetamidase/formamidase family protein [Parviterribacteraceae bacterium J379]